MKKIETPYWAIPALVSVFGMMSSLTTARTSTHPAIERLHLPSDVVEAFVMLTSLAALGASFAGLWSMMQEGVQKVGSIAAICIPVYCAPWICFAWILLRPY